MNGNAKNRKRQPALAAGSIAAAAAWALVACGGGGGGGDNAGGGGGGGSTSLALTGSAATGAAIAGKLVEAKCGTGTGSATTATDGSYTITISGGALPCVLRVSAPDGTVLHSVATGSGASATAHLTPATQLVVARLASADPATYYGGFNATAAAGITATALSTAQAAVIATLKAGGVDLGTITDLVAGALRPKTGSTTGDAYDGVLEALAARLTASGTTLAALTTVVVNEATNLGNTTPTSGTVSLPPAMLLQPAASNCSALRSGTYRVVSPADGQTLAAQTGTVSLNASTLVVTDGADVQPAWTANGSCRFTADAGATDIAVSQAGILVVRSPFSSTSTTRNLGIAFPEQTHTLAELAGNWNLIGMERNGANTGYTGAAGSLTLDASGAMSGLNICMNDTTWGLKGSDCVAVTGPMPTLRVNTAGGFDIVDAGTTTSTSRLFAYRAGSGELMLVSVDDDGSVLAWTRQRTNTMPTVGAVTTNWNFYAGPLLTSTVVVDATSNTIASVDTTAGSFLRNQLTVPSTVTRPETLFINNPRNGYTWRRGETVVDSSGASATISEFTSLPLRGMGVSAVVFPTRKLFLLSVVQ